MATMQDVIDAGRLPLNDEDKTRVSDSELLGYAIRGINEARRIRPDLFIGRWSVSFESLAFTSTFPLPDQYLQAIADYATGRAEFKDDEHVNSGRAVAVANLFAIAMGAQ